MGQEEGTPGDAIAPAGVLPVYCPKCAGTENKVFYATALTLGSPRVRLFQCWDSPSCIAQWWELA